MRPVFTRTLRLAPVAIATAALGACANLESFSIGELPVPEGSPVAVAAREAARNPGPYPTFAGIPRARDTDVDAARRTGERANIDQLALELRQMAATLPPVDEAEIEAFAAQSKAVFDGIEPPSANSAAEIEALARELRARATPPPPPS